MEDHNILVTFATHLELSEIELLAIINNPANMIARGVKTSVYQGVLRGGKAIAIKVLNIWTNDDEEDDKETGESELLREAQTLSKLRHRNILKVLGLFLTQEVKAMVMEFMPKESLHKQLHEVDVCELAWETRLNIAFGVAQGLEYLHNEFQEPVIHRDIKSRNILLDDDFEPRLGDFGISKFANPRRYGEATASNFCGTIGYIPPEYGSALRVSRRGDVYSYGIILLELMTRKQPLDQKTFGLDRDFRTWVLDSLEENPMSIMDPILLSHEITEKEWEQMKLLLQLALLCTQNQPQSRPEISEVSSMLKQIQEIGLDPPSYPSVGELAEEITTWSPPYQNNANSS